MSLNGIGVLLLQQCDSATEADRAFSVMQPWSLAFYPSEIQQQVDRARAIVRGEEPGCRNDPLRPVAHEPGSDAPIGADGLCRVCGQPRQAQCDCTPRRGRHAKTCPAAA